MGIVITRNASFLPSHGLADILSKIIHQDTTMETTVDEGSKPRRRRKKRRGTEKGKKMHWSVLLFFVVISLIIIYKAFEVISKVWTNQLP